MTIKLITLNLWIGGILFDEILAFLEREKPDVLLLQEVYNAKDKSLKPQYRSMQVIQDRLHFAAQDFVPMYLEKFPFGKLERGNAIMSRFPIIDRQEYWLHGQYEEYEDLFENFAASPRNLQHVVLELERHKLNVFNFQGVWDLDGENDSPDRLQMSQVIVNAIKGKDNVILAGDTNVLPNTQTIANIEKHLTNVFKDELTTSFNLKRKDLIKFPGYANAVVDMVFASPNLKVTKHYCPEVDISDHLPLVAVFEMP